MSFKDMMPEAVNSPSFHWNKLINFHGMSNTSIQREPLILDPTLKKNHLRENLTQWLMNIHPLNPLSKAQWCLLYKTSAQRQQLK